MLSKFARGAIVLATLTSLGACASGTSIMPEGLQTTAPLRAPGIVPDKSSPCNMTNSWDFRGPCQEFTLNDKGHKVALATYHGLSVVAQILSNSAYPPANKFVVGMGTGDADITGTLEGFKFPEYGSIGCVDQWFAPVTCKGKGFLYVLLRNPNASEFGMNLLPLYRIANSGAFPGTKCQEANLNYSNNQFVWRNLPVYASPQNGSITFKERSRGFSLAAGQGAAFAFFCY